MTESNTQMESLAFERSTARTFSYRFWKRLLDLTLGCIGVAILCPSLVLLSLLIKLTSVGPIIVRQERIGWRGRPFFLYKFRTMYAKTRGNRPFRAEHLGAIFKVRDDPRITPVGKLLRKTSLDELPQLWNVIKGDMSLVGPRPAFKYELAGIDEAERDCRLSVRPGLTGLWQISAVNDITGVREMVEVDNAYCRDWSFWLDLKIIWKTVVVAFGRSGAF